MNLGSIPGSKHTSEEVLVATGRESRWSPGGDSEDPESAQEGKGGRRQI